MKITETKLRRLIRDLILETDEGKCAEMVFGGEEDEDSDPDLLAEPASEYLEDARDEEKNKPKKKSLKQVLDDTGVDETSTVAGSLGAPAGESGNGGRTGPLGDEDRGSIYGKPRKKKKQRA